MNEDSRQRLLIADQSLRDLDGHHFEYDFAVAAAARSLGLAPVILANLDYRAGDALGAPVVPWFRQDWLAARRGPAARFLLHVLARLPSGLRHLVIGIGGGARRWLARRSARRVPALPSFGRELHAGLTAQAVRADDHVFIHTVAISELHAVIAALEAQPELPYIHVVLRRDADEPFVRDDPWGGVGAAIERARATPQLRRKLCFYADTPQLADQYNAIIGSSEVAVLPVPHALPATPAAERPARPPLRLVYLGNARTEKGFHLLAAAMDELRETHLSTGRIQLIAQANAPQSLDQELIVNARRRLSSYSSEEVQLIDAQLSIAEFQALLFSADIVLLPYDARLYRRRSSGILVQAMVAGKPVVVPADSWLAAEAGPAVSSQFSPAVPLSAAIAEAVETFAERSAMARHGAAEARAKHSADALVAQLIEAAR
ncbi:hypothetical protein VW23_001860 [Devosia insulae DS-56]|uniref:Glycosyl transferase family 1 domain-containing protein n=1 Tax=Devosia insulae DS-56 TaxID=1116389 RepID=A0A1E5XM34_9HYPH|nr:glycosyltransferase [Devosia insulae]OEO29661.1 hypothetical protein VW23_001860 [Devosia insulae DS-56]